MKVALHTTQAAHQLDAMTKFSFGLKRHHVSYVIEYQGRQVPGADVAVFWGVRNKKLQSAYDNRLIMERGYYGDRTRFTSIGWNGLNGRADFRNNGVADDRISKHPAVVQPWQGFDGECVLLVGQVQGDMSIDGVDITRWYAQMIANLSPVVSLPVVFRPHPLARSTVVLPNGFLNMSNAKLEDDLHRAAAVFTFNSNTGVDALLAGKPVFSADKGSMVWEVSAHDINDTVLMAEPDRERWLAELAYCQWTSEEIINGDAWSHLIQGGLPCA